MLYTSFYLDGKELGPINWREEGSTDLNHEVELYIDLTDDKEHDLKVITTLKSGSGSVADFANMEHHIGEFNFKVRFIDRNQEANSLEISQTLDENKHLKLSWSKPELPVDRYEIYDNYASYTPMATVYGDRNWFVDEDYFYGFRQYKVVAYILNSPDISYEGLHTVEYTTITEDHFEIEILGPEKARLIFNNPNPYPLRLAVEDRYGNIYKVEDGKDIIFKKTLFPVYYQALNVYLIPEDYEGNNYSAFQRIDCYYSDNSLEGSPNVTTINAADDQIIGLYSSNYYVYDKNLQKARGAIIQYNLSSVSRINSLTNGMVAIQDINNYLHMYSDNTISRELWALSLEPGAQFATGKEKIAVTEPPEINKLSIYDATTKARLLTVDYGVEQHYSRKLYPRISYDL